MMIPGLQTHFNGLVDLDTLRQVRTFGFRMVRMDAQQCSVEMMQQMIENVRTCGLIPLVIVSDLVRLAAVPGGVDAEWTNEPDGDIDPSVYRRDFDEACRVATERRIRLWSPAISNLDQDSIKWLRDLRDAGKGWPAGLHGVSVHRYGDGTFEKPHRGFKSRDREVHWLKETVGPDRPFGVSEFGYPSMDDVSEQDQAERVAKEWAFWEEQGAAFALLFQINDGSECHREHRYGIRRCDASGALGEWKPVAYTVPKRLGEDPMIAFANAPILEPVTGELVTGSEPETVAVVWPPDGDTVLSVQPDGRYESRLRTAIGAWESAKRAGANLIYEPDGKAYVVPLIERL